MTPPSMITRSLLPVFGGLREIISKLISNPQVAELLRFIFLGTVVEVSRLAGQKAIDFAKHFFIVKASFERDDFAFDWVKRYLEDLRVWDNSRVFRVTSGNPHAQRRSNTLLDGQMHKYKEDGRPSPVYQPAPNEPELFRWRNHWVTVHMVLDNRKEEATQILTLSVWSRNRKILDDFVQEARTHFFDSTFPPRELTDLPDKSGSVMTSQFMRGDISYDWMFTFMRSREEFDGLTDLQATTKPSDLYYSKSSEQGMQPIVVFKPAPNAIQRVRWRGHWVQLELDPNAYNLVSNTYCECIVVTIHNSKRSVLQELVEAAREEYLKSTISKVTVHLSNADGVWMHKVTKSRRSLNTLILPNGVKEALLDDARDFLASEEWYTWAGVPHRRGYLLYGEPGTGKSTTIHALAGELGLEIYYIQLASQGMSDSSLAHLISETPSRCIILLEDLDCAFPSREDEDEDEQAVDISNLLGRSGQGRRSEVTLSGLLNVLDSVSSEEGRITFATTNHIEKLDPALIRAGRMDVKIEYKLATRTQISQTFLRFFERSQRFSTQGPRPPAFAISSPKYGVEMASLSNKEAQDLTDEGVLALSEQFADIIPEDTFAIAQVQGLLLTNKHDPRGAVAAAKEWVEEQLDERRRIEDLKEKRRNKSAKARLLGPGTPSSTGLTLVDSL